MKRTHLIGLMLMGAVLSIKEFFANLGKKFGGYDVHTCKLNPKTCGSCKVFSDLGEVIPVCDRASLWKRLVFGDACPNVPEEFE